MDIESQVPARVPIEVILAENDLHVSHRYGGDSINVQHTVTGGQYVYVVNQGSTAEWIVHPAHHQRRLLDKEETMGQKGQLNQERQEQRPKRQALAQPH